MLPKYHKTFITILFYLIVFKPLHSVETVILKQGRVIKGHVTGQNIDTVEVQSIEGKQYVLPKKSVLKIVYKDISEEEEQKIRQQEITKRELAKQKLLEEKEKERLKKEEEYLANLQKSEPSNTNPYSSSIRNSFVLATPNPEQTIILANLSQNCKKYSEYPEYFWLFGSFRFKEPDLKSLIPKDGKPIRISQYSTNMDILVTAIGAFFTTITRKTLIIETCDGQGYHLLSDLDIQRIKDRQVSDTKQWDEIEKIQEQKDLQDLESDLQQLNKRK
ncbi:hypothetical protein LPTSP4_32640 [Leptospira ryugenii]|uniref:Uncharacterized protein n=1 Tax=Leptospira ryugenii TaxID=1917863 RepID=A0A2P2E4E3_9LEPT|nr:hypothetical protein [Leptospira ryugenii]GBF51726.1 hypothetical protein LPTSP4_32640 [Leptospira ryugenii]